MMFIFLLSTPHLVLWESLWSYLFAQLHLKKKKINLKKKNYHRRNT